MRILIGVIAAVLVACAATARSAEYSAPASLLIIQNQRTDDAWVYLERAGARSRKLGRVRALATDTVVLRESDAMTGTLIQFVAIAFASGAVDQSDEITAERGVVYVWQLGPGRGHQFLSERSADGEVTLADGTSVLDSTKVCRAPSCRSTTQRNRFMRRTKFPRGRAGWIVDHMKPLECGGEDLPTNMQWQTVDEAKAKDRIERDCSRWLP
jgi:hypothetical protein